MSVAEPGAAAPPPAPPVSRMAVAVLALVGLLVAGYLTLYKLGYLGIIQCTTGGCETVQSSRYAYLFGVPVAAYGVGEYLVLLVLALLGVQPRWVRERWVALAIFAVAAVGFAFTAYLTYLEAFVIGAWCQWCLVSAAIITLVFLLSIPGLRYAR
ncbi:MAG TPA: vitamin K epoxide reductase family protein [Longimicrobiaceae bacterium]|nr:vitamin K epoxide reductase family protein [Longimicrobiaceae bacterium]